MPLRIERKHLLFAIAPQFQFLKIRDFRHQSGSEHRHRFLRIRRIALRAVNQLRARTTFKLDLCGEAIRKGQPSIQRPGALGTDSDWPAEQEAEQIKKMAPLAENPSTALVVICVPRIRIELPGE